MPFYRTKAMARQERYAACIAANPARFSLDMHTEGGLDDYPALFVKSGDELRRNGTAHLLLAQALGAVRAGTGGLQLLSKDADGFDNVQQTLGANLSVGLDTDSEKSSESICARSIIRQRTTPWAAGIGPSLDRLDQSCAIGRIQE